MLLLTGLGFHLLHLDGVRLPAPHVQFMVAHAELQDPLVNSQTRGIKHEVLEETPHSQFFDCRHHPATNVAARHIHMLFKYLSKDHQDYLNQSSLLFI